MSGSCCVSGLMVPVPTTLSRSVRIRIRPKNYDIFLNWIILKEFQQNEGASFKLLTCSLVENFWHKTIMGAVTVSGPDTNINSGSSQTSKIFVDLDPHH
jgi:hypothetical protein